MSHKASAYHLVINTAALGYLSPEATVSDFAIIYPAM
jgi:hypothetical protein